MKNYEMSDKIIRPALVGFILHLFAFAFWFKSMFYALSDPKYSIGLLMFAFMFIFLYMIFYKADEDTTYRDSFSKRKV